MRRLRNQRAQKFAAKFVSNGFNAQRAVVDCGITQNLNSAHVIGWRLLKHPTTQKAIIKHMANAKMTADEVLERLTEVARTDAEFKGSDVVKAAELLGKGHKLFIDKVETTDVSANSQQSAWAAIIADLADENGELPLIVERQLQARCADNSKRSYREDQDPSKHPELWPSGNLLAQPASDLPTIEGGNQ